MIKPSKMIPILSAFLLLDTPIFVVIPPNSLYNFIPISFGPQARQVSIDSTGAVQHVRCGIVCLEIPSPLSFWYVIQETIQETIQMGSYHLAWGNFIAGVHGNPIEIPWTVAKILSMKYAGKHDQIVSMELPGPSTLHMLLGVERHSSFATWTWGSGCRFEKNLVVAMAVKTWRIQGHKETKKQTKKERKKERRKGGPGRRWTSNKAWQCQQTSRGYTTPIRHLVVVTSFKRCWCLNGLHVVRMKEGVKEGEGEEEEEEGEEEEEEAEEAEEAEERRRSRRMVNSILVPGNSPSWFDLLI